MTQTKGSLCIHSMYWEESKWLNPNQEEAKWLTPWD